MANVKGSPGPLARGYVGAPILADPAPRTHAVQFYEGEEFLYEVVGTFLATGLKLGERIVIVATEAHRQGILRHLREFDIEGATSSGQVLQLDARETLARFMVGDMPDADLFGRVVAETMGSRAVDGHRPVRVYGEMVDVLWREGNSTAAIRLEELWNDAGKDGSFSLLCAYLMGNFFREGDASRFVEVCRNHTHVIPTETFAKLQEPHARLREISSLQQRARALEGEIQVRKELESALRDALKDRGRVEAELRECVEREQAARAASEASAEVIRLSEGRYRSLVVATSAIIWARSPGGEFVSPQPQWSAFTGQSFEGLRGSGWLDAVHPDDRDTARKGWAGALVQSTAAYEGEHRLRRHDGEYRYMTVRAVPVRNEDGSIREWVGVHRDVTRQHEIDGERERLIGALAATNAELDQFAYVASHDLKAPLRGIANLSKWIEEDLADRMTDESRRNLELLRRRTVRLENLIDGILSYSRAGRGLETVELVDVGALAKEVVDLLGVTAPAAVVIAGELPVVWAEGASFQQILMNFVGNALKYGGASVRVEISARDTGSHWEFAVADDGPGIAPEFHQRIWAIFQTLHPRDQVEGTGIGLSVVKKVVESRGGKVWVDSSPGTGATFFFSWPKRPVG